MRNILAKLNNNMLLFSIIFIVFNISINFILYLFDLRFRFWILFLIVIISGVILFWGIFKALKKLQNRFIFKMLNIFSAIVIFLIVIPIFNVILWINYSSEKVAILDNQKYISLKGFSLKKRDIFYYDYVNPFIVGTKIKVYGDYGLKTNYIGEVIFNYYDSEGNNLKKAQTNYRIKDKDIIKLNEFIFIDVENNEDREIVEDDYFFPEDGETLYEKQFNNVVIKVNVVGYALGQKKLVEVVKSVDGGENFNCITDDYVIASDTSKIIFLNEKVGFISRTGDIGLEDSSVNNLYVTNDGGKTFKEAKLIYSPQNDIVISVYIEEMPIYDGKELLMKCSIYDLNDDRNGYVTKNLWFKSKDNGITWNVKL